MKKTYIAAGLGALLAFSAFSAAQAEERWPRWYVGLHGGYTYMSDKDISGSPGVSRMSLDNGYGYGGSIGYLPTSSAPLLNSLRFEAEVTHHTANVDKVKVSGVNVNGHGDLSSTAYMANVYYDLPTNNGWAPYVGAGVGMASVHLSKNSGTGNTDTTDNEFAYQALAGIGYSPSSLPNTQWILGYRYLATSDATFSGAPGTNVKTEYSTHSIEAGAHFRF